MIPEPKTAAWHEQRRKTLGGSDANILMSGDADAIRQLWKVKTGIAQPESLDGEFRVQLGIFTEAFNVAWFEKRTGLEVEARNAFKSSDRYPFMAANLDGIVALASIEHAVFEAKHTGAHGGMSVADILPRYQPQLHHNMIVTGLRKAFLSVIIGNEWDYIEVEFDAEYAERLLKIEEDFWECVTLKMPPSEDPETVVPPPAVRELDMTGDNEFATLAADWLSKQTPAKEFAAAVTALKAKVPADAKLVKGYGITISRNKARSLTIKEEKK